MPAESKTAMKARMDRVRVELHKGYPDAHCALHYRSPLELLVATILSAQTTDVHVNEVTPGLFRKYRKAKDYADAPLEELQGDIQTIGLFRNKSKFIQGACRMIVEGHKGKVPQTMDELLELPGVARKTANVVLGNAFGVASGIVVDTHVNRLAKRLGFARLKQKDSNKVEKVLMELTPQDDWVALGHALVWHGRQICHARKPKCSRCCIEAACPRKGVKDAKKMTG